MANAFHVDLRELSKRLDTASEQGLLMATLVLVPTMKLMSSGLEAIVDKVCSSPDELAGRAKDMGSAAVTVTIIVMLLIWGGIALARFAA